MNNMIVILVGCSVVDVQPAETKQKISAAVSGHSYLTNPLVFIIEGLLCTYQKVNGVLWFDLAAL